MSLWSFYLTNQMHNINPLTPNYHYSGRTAPLTSKRCILYIYIFLYIYSTNSLVLILVSLICFYFKKIFAA